MTPLPSLGCTVVPAEHLSRRAPSTQLNAEAGERQARVTATVAKVRGWLLGVFAACAALSWLVPNHYLPWTSFHNELVAATAAAIAMVACLISPSVRWPRIAWLPLMLVAIPMIQHAIGQVHFLSDAALASTYLLGCALAIATGATLRTHHPEGTLTALAAAFLVGAIASVGLALCQLFQINLGIFLVDFPQGGRPYANLAQPNHLATLMGLGAAAGLLAFELRRIGSGAAVLLMMWLGLGLVMTQSRTGWLFVGVLVLGAWAAISSGIRLRLTKNALVVGVIAFVMGTVAWPALTEVLLLSAPQDVQERMQSNVRLLHWRTLADALVQAPWMGYGWNQVALAQQAAVLLHPPSRETLEHSHNAVFDFLIWNGIPLGALIIALIVAWLWRQIRNCSNPAEWAGLLGLAAIAVHSLTEYPLDYAYFLLPLGLIMGALSEATAAPPRAQQAKMWGHRALVVPALLAIVMLVWIASEYGRVEQGMRELRFAQAGYGTTLANVRPPEVFLLDGPREFQRFARTEASKHMSAEELDWMRRVSSRFPYPPSLFRFAVAAGLNGNAHEARDVLGKLCRMNPQSRCIEAAQAWQALQAKYPELLAINVPEQR
jgi:O-antigen ligase